MASRILIVGEQPGAGTTLAIRLGLEGYDTYGAADVHEADGVACWWLPDAIVLDLDPSPSPQLAAAAWLHRRHPGVPLVALSRDEDLVSEEEVEAAGCSLLFTRPLDFREFRLSLEWAVRCCGEPRRERAIGATSHRFPLPGHGLGL